MKSITFVLGAFLASVAIAQPHLHRQHQAKHQHKRNRQVVWVTDYEYTTTTVDATTTIWVSAGFVPPTESTTSASTTPSPSSSSKSAAQFFEGASKPASKPSSTSVYVAPVPTSTSTSTYVAPTTSVAPVSVAPAPVVESSSTSSSAPTPIATPVETPVVTPVVETPVSSPAAVVYNAPAATTSSAAPVATTPTTSSSYSGTCSSGSPCDGDITYYEAGLGACGNTNNGDSENVVALPHGLMGTQSNGNPYCGKTITIKCTSTGKTTTATVQDKCMGCTGNSIDLSNKAFLEISELSVGRTDATWWFNE